MKDVARELESLKNEKYSLEVNGRVLDVRIGGDADSTLKPISREKAMSVLETSRLLQNARYAGSGDAKYLSMELFLYTCCGQWGLIWREDCGEGHQEICVWREGQSGCRLGGCASAGGE